MKDIKIDYQELIKEVYALTEQDLEKNDKQEQGDFYERLSNPKIYGVREVQKTQTNQGYTEQESKISGM